MYAEQMIREVLDGVITMSDKAEFAVAAICATQVLCTILQATVMLIAIRAAVRILSRKCD